MEGDQQIQGTLYVNTRPFAYIQDQDSQTMRWIRYRQHWSNHIPRWPVFHKKPPFSHYRGVEPGNNQAVMGQRRVDIRGMPYGRNAHPWLRWCWCWDRNKDWKGTQKGHEDYAGRLYPCTPLSAGLLLMAMRPTHRGLYNDHNNNNEKKNNMIFLQPTI